jgi:L-alanine-DL-glutamate epimerase-like enolase superfamily enzyme
MARQLEVSVESFPIAGTFAISRGSKVAADVVVCTVRHGDATGRGECVPYARYGESLDGVRAAIEAAGPLVAAGIDRSGLLTAMQPGAARSAVDCALWDLEAKLSGQSAWTLAGAAAPGPLTTAFTLSLADAEAMGAQARANAHRPVLKIKVGGGGDDIARMRAVVTGAPQSRIIVDANEGWTEAGLRENLQAAAALGIALIEQPLPAGRDDMLAAFPRPVPVCADESLHTVEGLGALTGRYDAVNIKLDKAGGLTAALLLRNRARELGFGVMVGCMVGTSLAMAPAVLLAQGADFVDLDGPLLLARDREPGLAYAGSVISPPTSALWG